MSNSILVAVDINRPVQEALVLKAAAKLAAVDGASLDVITVLPDYGSSFVGSFFEPDFHDKAVNAAQDALKALVSETLGAATDAEVRHLVTSGKAYEKILDAAEKAGSDLIVIGAHDPDLHDFLLGPNAARVVRHAKASVYVVRS